MTAEQAYLQASRYFPWDHYLPTGASVIFSSPLQISLDLNSHDLTP